MDAGQNRLVKGGCPRRGGRKTCAKEETRKRKSAATGRTRRHRGSGCSILRSLRRLGRTHQSRPFSMRGPAAAPLHPGRPANPDRASSAAPRPARYPPPDPPGGRPPGPHLDRAEPARLAGARRPALGRRLRPAPAPAHKGTRRHRTGDGRTGLTPAPDTIFIMKWAWERPPFKDRLTGIREDRRDGLPRGRKDPSGRLP